MSAAVSSASFDERASSARALGTLILVSRPIGWLVAAGLFRAGVAYSDAPPSLTAALFTVAMTFPFCVFLFGLNDLADWESDARNPRKGNVLFGAKLDQRWMRRITTSAVVLAGVSFLAWFVVLRPLPAALLAGVLVLSFLYSVRLGRLPRLKDLPVIDGLTSAGIITGVMAIGFTLGGRSLRQAPIEPLAFAPAIVAIQLLATIPDREPDRAVGHATLAVRAGPRVTAATAAAFAIVPLLLMRYVSFAPPVAWGAVAVAVATCVHLLFPGRISARHAFVGIGAAGLGCLLWWLAYL